MSVETPKKSPEQQNSTVPEHAKEVRKDLDDLLRSKNLDDLRGEALEKVITTIYAKIDGFPLSKKPIEHSEEEKRILAGIFTATGGLLHETLLRNAALPPQQQKNFSSPEVFLQTITPDSSDTGGVKVMDFLRRVFEAKETNPELYALVFQDWAKAVAYLQEHAGSLQQKAQKQIEEYTSPQNSSISHTPEKKDWWEYLRDPKMLGLGIGGVGAALLIYTIFAKKEGWSSKLLPAVIALVGIGMATGGKFNIMDFFQQFSLKSSSEEQPLAGENSASSSALRSGPREANEKEGWKSLKEVYKDGYTAMEYTFNEAARTFERNKGAGILAGITFAKIPLIQSIFFSGSSLGLTSVMALAKLPLGAAAHHPVGALFAVSGFLMMKDKVENLGDVKVPATPEALKTYLQENYSELEQFCTRNGLVVPKKNNLGETVDLLTGKIALMSVLPKGQEFSLHVLQKAQSLLAGSPEKVLLNSNRDALRVFVDFLRHQQEKDTEHTSYYRSLSEKITALLDQVVLGKTLTKTDFEALSASPEFLALGYELTYEDGYVRISKYISQQGIKTIAEGFPQVIGVDPTLKLAEQQKNAVRLATQNEWTQIFNVPMKQIEGAANFTLERALSFLGSPSLESALSNGIQFAVAGGRVFIMGATQRLCLGSLDILRGSLGAALDGDKMGFQQVLMQYGSSVLPITVFATLTSLGGGLHNPLKEGLIKSVAKSAIYPVKQAAQILGFPLIQGYKMGSAMVNKSTYKGIVQDPFHAAAMQLTARLDSVQKLRYAFTPELSARYKSLAELKTAKALLIESGRTIIPFEVKTLVKGQAGYINDAKSALKDNVFGNEILRQFGDLEQSNRQKVGEMVDLAMQKNAELIDLEKKKMKLPSNSPEAKRISDLIETIEKNVLDEIRLNGSRYRAKDTAKQRDKTNLDVHKSRANIESVGVALESRGRVMPKGYSEAVEEMEKLRHGLSGKTIDERLALFSLYEKAANGYLDKATKRIGQSKLDDTATKNVTEAIASRATKLAEIKATFAQELVGAYKSLPKLQQTKARAEAINQCITDNNGRIATKVLSMKGRTMLFAAQFATVLTAQTAAETMLDKDHDLLQAVKGIASMDTLQMLIDLLPGVGTLSSAMSTVTGVKSLSTFGVKFENSAVDRWESAGWGLVSLGSDILMFVPVAGTAVKGGVIAGRLTALAAKFPAAAKLLTIWPKVEVFAKTVGWEKALPALISVLQKNIRGINVATTVGTVAMTTYSVGKIAVAYGAPRELELAKAPS